MVVGGDFDYFYANQGIEVRRHCDMLSFDRIRVLANRKHVNAIAVHNFLGTVSANHTLLCAMVNLYSDAEAYRWNAATVNAIRVGITEHFKGA